MKTTQGEKKKKTLVRKPRVEPRLSDLPSPQCPEFDSQNFQHNKIRAPTSFVLLGFFIKYDLPVSTLISNAVTYVLGPLYLISKN